MPNPIVDKVRNLVEPAVAGAGYELVEIEWKHEQGGFVLRAFIDRQDGSGKVGHEDCEKVSRELSAVLDVHDVIPHAYSLEVSSPGLDRPLRTRAHFERHVGHEAKVRLVRGVDGRRNYRGTIVRTSADGNTVTMNVDGKDHTLPLDDLEKANLVYEFEDSKGKRE